MFEGSIESVSSVGCVSYCRPSLEFRPSSMEPGPRKRGAREENIEILSSEAPTKQNKCERAVYVGGAIA